MDFGLDLAGGVRLWSAEIYGDWYRDPWGWPELRWLTSNLGKLPVGELVTGKGGSVRVVHKPVFHMLDIPKSRLGARPAVLQDPLSHLIYLAAISASAGKLHEKLPDFVYGWRLRTNGRPEKNRDEWPKYVQHIQAGALFDAGMQADITSFFGSMDLSLLRDNIYQDLGKTAASAIICDIADSHSALARRSGLPQRNFGSSILANYYMRPIDESLMIAVSSGRAALAARWMDDIVAFGREDHLYALHMDIEEKARLVGLELNSAKSHLGSASEVVDSINLEGMTEVKVRWKYLQGGYADAPEPDPQDMEALLQLESVALERGPSAPRSWLRATLVSLVNAYAFDREAEWRNNAKNIPHAADSLGRYLKEYAALADFAERSGRAWGDLSEWIVDYLGSPWCKLDWVKAQLSLAIPSWAITEGMRHVMQSWLAESQNVQLIAVAGHRLATTDPGLCLQLIRSRVDTPSDALVNRILALSVLHAGGERTLARALISHDDCNLLLATALDDCHWAAPPTAKDFDHGE